MSGFEKYWRIIFRLVFVGLLLIYGRGVNKDLRLCYFVYLCVGREKVKGSRNCLYIVYNKNY